ASASPCGQFIFQPERQGKGGSVIGCLLTLLCSAMSGNNALTLLPAASIVAQQTGTTATPPVDPSPYRPLCKSMFLASDWQLASKQNACEWVNNRLFSLGVLASATWSAATAPIWTNWLGHDAAPEGFTKRLGANLTQNAFKSTATYLVGV